jgi:predicted dehydrogenase
MAPPVRIGMIGTAFMGRSHSHAWRNVGAFFDLPQTPVLQVICGRNPDTTRAAADRMGWSDTSSDWRAVIERDDVDLIDICTPGSSHAEIAIAALEAGKHVLCEKPLANTVEEAQAMTDAAEKASAAGIRSMCGFNYRRVPALELARRLIAEGRLGTIRQVRAVYLQDWIVDPDFPMVWRLDATEAGSGSLGDIGSHIVDMTQHLLASPITEVAGLTETFIPHRPLPGGGTGTVTVDDAAIVLARWENGVIGTLEATRFATGRKNGMHIELNGSLGSIIFDLERLNELEVYETSGGSTAGFRRVLVTEADHPWVGAWWPPGHIVGWEHTFTHQARDLLLDIDVGRAPSPSFAEGLQVQRVLEAVQQSAAARGWTAV